MKAPKTPKTPIMFELMRETVGRNGRFMTDDVYYRINNLKIDQRLDGFCATTTIPLYLHGKDEFEVSYKNNQLTVIIMEDAYLGLTIHTIYPVDTRHLSRNEIDAILQDANNYCKTGVVMHNEGPDIFSYVFLYNTNEYVPKGISIEVLLHTASEETDYVLEYLDHLKEQFNLYTFEEIMESYN